MKSTKILYKSNKKKKSKTNTLSYQVQRKSTQTNRYITVTVEDRIDFFSSGMDFVSSTTSTTVSLLESGHHKSLKKLDKHYTPGSSHKCSTSKAYLLEINAIMRICCLKSLDLKVARLTISCWRICGIDSWSLIGFIKITIRRERFMWIESLLYVWRFSAFWSIKNISIH